MDIDLRIKILEIVAKILCLLIPISFIFTAGLVYVRIVEREVPPCTTQRSGNIYQE